MVFFPERKWVSYVSLFPHTTIQPFTLTDTKYNSNKWIESTTQVVKTESNNNNLSNL